MQFRGILFRQSFCAKKLMLFGAHLHRVSESPPVTRLPRHQNAPVPQRRKPCRRTHGFLSLSRVQGGSACSESRGEAFGPRHFAGFRRKAESVMVGSTTFAESAVPRYPVPQTQLLSLPPENTIPRQTTTSRIAPPSQPQTGSNRPVASASAVPYPRGFQRGRSPLAH